MFSDELHYKQISEIAGLLASRKLSPVELVEHLLHRRHPDHVLDADALRFPTGSTAKGLSGAVKFSGNLFDECAI
jgi:hypothetical protein